MMDAWGASVLFVCLSAPFPLLLHGNERLPVRARVSSLLIPYSLAYL